MCCSGDSDSALLAEDAARPCVRQTVLEAAEPEVTRDDPESVCSWMGSGHLDVAELTDERCNG